MSTHEQSDTCDGEMFDGKTRNTERMSMIQGGNAVVTGASSGLGRELVRQLVLDRGMTVLATARRLANLESLAAELPHGHVLILAGDLTDAVFRKLLWDRAETMAGGIDLLVNNAGMGNYADFATQDQRAIRQIIDLNVLALIDLSQKAARYMKDRGSGQILQISSVLGFIGIRDSAVYVASKHAVNGLVKSLRYELWGTGVRVWAACPGRTASEFRQVALGNRGREVGRLPTGEPTAKIVRAIVRGLDRRSAFVLPSWRAWIVVTLAHWLPAPFDWIMCRWSPGSYKDVLAHPPSKGAS
jgi:short-subunit dehydrogenase